MSNEDESAVSLEEPVVVQNEISISPNKSAAGSDKTKSGTVSAGKKSKSNKKIASKARVVGLKVARVEEEEVPQLPPECCPDLKDEVKMLSDPMKNRMNLEWFQKIRMPPEEYKHLCFSESLLMVDEVGNVSGKMYTSVKPSKFGDKHCLCVHSGCYGTPDPDLECGTTITGFVSFDMKPFQEFVHEWAVCEGKVTERKIFIMKEEDVMHITISLYKDGEVVEQKAINLSRLEQRLLVTESVNIVLLRLIMLEKRAGGDMELKTLAFTGSVVKNKYVTLTNGWENVKGEQVRTWSIRRTVEFEFGERLWDSMLNQFGRLILRCQPENVHALIPLWFEPVKESKKGKHEACYPPYIWACDAELHAKYLLKRDELAADHRCYLLEHPDLRAVLSDFVQAVLLRKPANLIPFTQQYFESFLKFRPDSQQPSVVSSSSSSNESDMGEWGEWDDGGEDAKTDSFRFYPVPPTRPLDGLEKVSSEEEVGEEEGKALTEGLEVVGKEKENSNVTVGSDEDDENVSNPNDDDG